MESASQFARARAVLASKSRVFTPKNPTPKEKALMVLGKEIKPGRVGLGGRRTRKLRRRGKKTRRSTRKW